MFARDKGQFYEQQALAFLMRSGLKPVARNYHGRFGEIDLIMREGDTLCFIEVKYRTGNSFGGAAYSLPYQKQQKILKAAMEFLTRNPKFQRAALRFDALLIQADQSGKPPRIDWIRSAFDAS